MLLAEYQEKLKRMAADYFRLQNWGITDVAVFLNPVHRISGENGCFMVEGKTLRITLPAVFGNEDYFSPSHYKMAAFQLFRCWYQLNNNDGGFPNWDEREII